MVNDGPPNLGHEGQKQFQDEKDWWWDHGQFTDAFSFALKMKPKFGYRVAPDRESVTVLFVKATPEANQQAAVIGPEKHADPFAQLNSVTHSKLISLSDRFIICRYDTVTWSKSRWQEESGQKHCSTTTAAWMQADPALQYVWEELPSAKVATNAAYEEHLQHRVLHLPVTQSHFCVKQYRALRWRTYRKRQPAMAKMCSCTTGNRRNTIVGYGDASCNSNSPTASLRRRLHSLCCVYNVDEFCTSMLCCACHQAGMTSPLQGTTSFLDLTLSMPCV